MKLYTNRFKSYIDACATILGLDQYNGELEFEYKKKLDQDAAGYCWDNDDGDVTIQIATHVQGEKLPIEDVLSNIAHEMIHAQQIASGRMKDFGVQLASAGDCQTIVHAVEWEGEVVTNVPYDDQPWEIEAYGNEERICAEASQLIPFKDYERYYG